MKRLALERNKSQRPRNSALAGFSPARNAAPAKIVLVLFVSARYIGTMSPQAARQASNYRRPPEPDPSHSGPAGRLSEPDIDPAANARAEPGVDPGRRRGRGAQSNATGRFEPLAAV